MKKYLLTGIVCFALVAFLGDIGCGPKVGPCGSDINCPTGQSCVAGKCQDTPPATEKADEKPTKDASVPEPKPEPKPEPQPEPKPEPKPEPTGPQSCSTNADCTRTGTPYCRNSVCVSGYATFSFTSGGTFIVDLNAPSKTCKSTNQCSVWQSCSSGSCRIKVNRSSKVTGKAGDEGISLTDYSLANITTIEGKQYLRILMNTNFSDRLDKEFSVEILLSKVKAGATLSIDGKDVRATFYNKHIEFVPSKNEVLATAASGTVKLIIAGTKVGQTVTGTADVIFK